MPLLSEHTTPLALFPSIYQAWLHVLGFFFCSSGIFAFPLTAMITLSRVVTAWTMSSEEDFFGWMFPRMWVEIWARIFVLGSGLELLLRLGWLFSPRTEYPFPLFRVYLAAFLLVIQLLGKVAGLDASGFEEQEATRRKIKKQPGV